VESLVRQHPMKTKTDTQASRHPPDGDRDRKRFPAEGNGTRQSEYMDGADENYVEPVNGISPFRSTHVVSP
jgi:hypothetical protein